MLKPIWVWLFLLTGMTASAQVGHPLTLRETIHQPEGVTSPREKAVYSEESGVAMIGFYTASSDNGVTWRRQVITPRFIDGIPSGWRRAFSNPPWRDPVNGNMLLLLNSIDRPIDRAVREPDEAFHWGYLRYAVSKDGGKNYTINEPIIQSGPQFTNDHPLDDVYLGVNGYMQGDLGNVTVRARSGALLVPIQVALRGEDGALDMPGGGSNYSYARVLHGVWLPDGRIKWDVGPRIMGDPTATSRGLMEPTLIEMPNGTLFMLCRGSNGWRHDPKNQWPSRKWAVNSGDGGKTWSKPIDWRYDDGGEIFSPSSMSRLIRHSSGRVLWIGNINPTNCQRNDPRHPLVIGEVSPVNLQLIRKTVLTLDKRTEADVTGLNLSHVWAYEDRVTGEIRVVLRRYDGNYRTFHGVDFVVGL